MLNNCNVTTFKLFTCLTILGMGLEAAAVKTEVTTHIKEHALIAVHHERIYDGCAVTADGLDVLQQKFKAKNLPVFFLTTRKDPKKFLGQKRIPKKKPFNTWVGNHMEADYALHSQGGEHAIPLETSEVTMTGG